MGIGDWTYQDVAVQASQPVLGHCRPVVVVGSATVVLLAVRQPSTDANHEHRSPLLADGILTFLRRQSRVALQQFLGMDKVNLLRQKRLQLLVRLAHQILRTTYGGIDAPHHVLQECQRAVLTTYHRLPVPLVHIQRMQVIQFLVGTNGVHVRIDAVAALHLLLSQCQSLPFRQRVHHLSPCVTHILDGERHRTLHAVQVVVDAQSLQHEQRCRHTAQPQFRRQVLLKEVLNLLDTLLRLTHVQQSLIPLRANHLTHKSFYLFSNYAAKVIKSLKFQAQCLKFFLFSFEVSTFLCTFAPAKPASHAPQAPSGPVA